MKRHIRVSLKLVCLLFLFTNTAQAGFVKCDQVLFSSIKPVKWTGNDETFRVSLDIWNDIGMRNALISAADQWNATSNMEITLIADTGTSMQHGNGFSEIYMWGGFPPWNPIDGVILADAWTPWGAPNLSTGKCYFNEGDMRINLNVAFDSTPEWGDFGGPNNLDLVVLHEFGHLLGQTHDNLTSATLNTQYPNSGPIGAGYEVRPHSPDSSLIRQVYGAPGTMIDVAASMWTIVPPPGQVFEGAAFTIDLIRDDYQTLTQGSVTRGENVFFRYSIENLGTKQEDLEVKFYMSNDTVIGDAGDIYMGMSYYTLQASTNLTGEKYVSIPTGGGTGFKHFGYTITPANGEPINNRANNSVKLFRTYWVQ